MERRKILENEVSYGLEKDSYEKQTGASILEIALPFWYRFAAKKRDLLG